jgi:hypothetical protein
MSSPAREPSVVALVQKFNALPRSPLLPSGYGPNKWIISRHFIPIPPAGDLFVFVNPFSRYMHTEGPIPADNRPRTAQTLREYADDMAIILLRGFVSGMGAPADAPHIAPWEWALDDNALRKPVEDALKRLGVRSELCVVGTANTEERKIMDETFRNLLQTMASLMS